MAKVTEITQALAEPIVQENGCTLWDVEYVKEAGVWYLRLYIDKENGVSINDCEVISRAVSDKLDEVDPIPDSYTFEVSSAGADRVLRKPEHFQACLGREVEVKLYRPEEGRRSWIGVLSGWENGDILLTQPDGERVFPKKDVAQVRLYVRV